MLKNRWFCNDTNIIATCDSFENWGKWNLYTSKERWNDLEIDLKAKKYYFSEKILVKIEFSDIWLKN